MTECKWQLQHPLPAPLPLILFVLQELRGKNYFYNFSETTFGEICLFCPLLDPSLLISTLAWIESKIILFAIPLSNPLQHHQLG